MKTIEQIKEENALLIAKNYLHICKGVSLKELTNELIAYAIQQYDIKTTLSNVLLALPETYEGHSLKYKILEKNCYEFGNEYFDGYRKCFVVRFLNVFDCDCCENYWTDIFIWDLTKETLEIQSEETQISINKLLKEKC